LPIVHTRWQLNVLDRNNVAGDTVYPTDLFGETSDGGDVPVVFNDLKAALLGGAFGDVPALKYGKIGGRRELTGVADFRFDIGYDWIRREKWHFATSFDFIAPVGTCPSAEFVFSPVIGEYKRWQLGGTVNAAYNAWNNCDMTSNLSLYLDATINTALASRQQRLLGLLIDGVSSPWSQYLVVKRFNAAGDAVALDRAANILAGPVLVAAPVIGDVGFMAQYTRNCFFGGLGYEFWGRAEEKLTGRCFDITPNTYGLQGQTTWTGTEDAANDCQNATASGTTIFQAAAADVVAGTTTLTSVFISNDDIDYCPALHPGCFSNKVFGFVGVNWTDCDWQPYVLIGGEVEFGSRAFNQWGIIGKGGLSF